MFRESFHMAVSNILHNRMRSFLTGLGIIIGVTAIIALMTVVQGVTSTVTSEFQALGTGKVMETALGTPLKRGLTVADLEALGGIDNVAAVSPTVQLTASALGDTGVWEENATVEGKSHAYFQDEDGLIGRGRPLNILDIEAANTVCVIDHKMAEKLFFAEDPVGRTVTIGGIAHTVVGVLAEGAGNDVLSQAQNTGKDGKLLVPYTDAMRLGGTRNILQLELQIDDTDRTDETVALIEHALSAAFNYKEDSYSLINLQTLLNTMNTVLSMMTTMLVGIASIALLVGGIGIMNMMLVSVTERTTEIGLRKALGAEPGQIQTQFLIESFVLSLLGGVIGVAVGLLLSALLCQMIGAAFMIYPSAIALGVGFSAAVGVIFGWTPARKASNLNPIDALRSV